MCPDFPNDELVRMRARSLRLETGSTDSHGPTGQPSPLESHGARLVRQHQGVSTTSVGSLILTEGRPGSFAALKRGHLDGYMVTLSCVLTSSEYGSLIKMLETTPGIAGENASVVVRFEPMTPNEVPPTTAPST